jgi:hypothetical protein
VHSGPWNAVCNPADCHAVGRFRALVPFAVALPFLALGAVHCQSDGGQTGDPGVVPRSGGGKDTDPCRLDALEPATATALDALAADGGVHRFEVLVVTEQSALRANLVLEATGNIAWSDDCEEAQARVNVSLNLRDSDGDAGTRWGQGKIDVAGGQGAVGGSITLSGLGKCTINAPSSGDLREAGAVAADSVVFVLRCP